MPRLADPHARDAGRRDGGDPGRAQRVAALVAAYHAGIAGPGDGTVAFGWVRTAAGGPIRVIAAGRALVGSAHPGGAHPDSAHLTGDPERRRRRRGGAARAARRGARDGAGARPRLAGLLDQVGCWREVAGISDGLLVAADEPGAAGRSGGPRAGGEAGLSLDEGLLGSWTGPFGWLVIAAAGCPGASCGRCRKRSGSGNGWPRDRRTGFPSGRRRRGGSRSATRSCSAASPPASGGSPSSAGGRDAAERRPRRRVAVRVG